MKSVHDKFSLQTRVPSGGIRAETDSFRRSVLTRTPHLPLNPHRVVHEIRLQFRAGKKVHCGLPGFWWECCECCECNKLLHSHLRIRHPQSEVGGPSHSVEKEGERAPTVLPTQQTPNLAKCHTLHSILDPAADRSWGGPVSLRPVTLSKPSCCPLTIPTSRFFPSL